jgi:hypothetical protein
VNREATSAAETEVTDLVRDVMVGVDDGVVSRFAANVVRGNERLSDAGEAPHWDVKWIAVAIGDPKEARAQAAHGGTRGVDDAKTACSLSVETDEP